MRAALSHSAGYDFRPASRFPPVGLSVLRPPRSLQPDLPEARRSARRYRRTGGRSTLCLRPTPRIRRGSEAHDLGEVNRFSLYEHLKTYTAAPPDVLRVDEKHLREYAVWNVCGVVITTNHRLDGLYLPPDDRRHYAAWSARTKADFDDGY